MSSIVCCVSRRAFLNDNLPNAKSVSEDSTNTTARWNG